MLLGDLIDFVLVVGFEPTKPKHGILRPAPLTAREYQLRFD